MKRERNERRKTLIGSVHRIGAIRLLKLRWTTDTGRGRGEKDDVYPNLWRIRVYAGLRMHILQEFKRFAYSHPAKIFSQSRLAKAKWIECPSWKQPNEIHRRVTRIVATIFAHRAAVRSNCCRIYDPATSSVFVSRVNDITRTMERRLNRVLLTIFAKPEVRRCDATFLTQRLRSVLRVRWWLVRHVTRIKRFSFSILLFRITRF